MQNAIQELRGMASEELITIAMLSTYSFKLQLAVVPSKQTNSSSVKAQILLSGSKHPCAPRTYYLSLLAK